MAFSAVISFRRSRSISAPKRAYLLPHHPAHEPVAARVPAIHGEGALKEGLRLRLVDSVHTGVVRLSLDDRLCYLVMVGVRLDGIKELVALSDGYRESTESWAELLRDLKRRGMRAPVLAVVEGAHESHRVRVRAGQGSYRPDQRARL